MNTIIDYSNERLIALSEMWKQALAEQANDEYDDETMYDIEFEFDIIHERIVLKCAHEMSFPTVEIKKESPERLSLHLYAEGLDGLKKIINFDRVVAKSILFDVADNLKLQDLQYQIDHPHLYSFKNWFKTKVMKPRQYFLIPTYEQLEQEIQRLYKEAGILFPDN